MSSSCIDMVYFVEGLVLPLIVEIVTYHHNHECELCIRKVEHWNQYRNTIGHDEIFLTLDFKGNAVNGTSTK